MSSWKLLSTRILLAAAFGGISAGILIVHSNILQVVGKAPAAMAWLSLIAAQGAIAGYGAVEAFVGYRGACKRPDGILFVLVFLGLLLGAFVAEPAYFKLAVAWPLSQHNLRVTLVSCLDGFSGLGAAAGLWTVAREAEASKEGELRDEALFFALRARLSGYVSFLGLQIGAAVLSTGMLRHTMIDGAWATEDAFPPELVLAYGAYFTVLVGIVYFLAASRLNELAEHLVDAVVPDDKADPWDRIKARLRASKALGLEGGTVKQFRAAVAILGPLLSALVSIAIPH